MRQAKIQSIRNSLVGKMETLWSIADNTIMRMKNGDGKCADPFDQAALESNKFVELACRDRERQLILDIQETIMRIDRGLFGTCDSCGAVISEKRILIEPMCKLCTSCQEEHERCDKQRYRRGGIKGLYYDYAR